MSLTLRAARALYRALLRLQPASVRGRFGGEMLELFDTLAGHAARRRGRIGVLLFMARATADAMLSAAVAHREAPDGLLRSSPRLPSPRLVASAALQELGKAERSLRRAPAFATIAVVTLALGIGTSVTAFSVVNAYLIRPLPFPEPDRLVWIFAAPSREAFLDGIRPPQGIESLPLDALRGTFEETAAWDLDGFTIVAPGDPEYVNGAWVSPGFFRTLGVAPALGRFFDENEVASGAPVAVISHALWQRLFGGHPGAIGRTLTAYATDRPRERELFTVVGVLPAEFWHFNSFTDVLVPLRGERTLSMARLASGVTIGQARARLDAVARAQFPDADPRWHMSVLGAREEHVHRVRPTLLVLLAAVGFVMLVACANVASLLVARAVERRRELAVRAALGAGRSRLVAQSLAESALLGLAAVTGGVALAVVALDSLGPVVAAQLPAAVPGGAAALSIDGTVLAFSAALAAVTLLAFGLLPALVHTAVDPARALAEASRTSTGGRSRARTRSTLVAAQLAVSLALLSGALMLVRTTLDMQRLALGFDPRNLAKASVLLPQAQYPEAAQRIAFVRAVLERLAAEREVVSATVVNSYPFRDIGPRGISAESVSDTTLVAIVYAAGDRYFETLGVPLRSGRAFDGRDDAAAPPVAIVSRSIAERAWPAGDPIGRRVRLGAASNDGAWRTVVGVVDDTRKNLTDPTPAPDLYVPYAQSPGAYLYLVVRTTDERVDAAAIMRDAVRQVDGRQPLADVGTIAEVLERAGASHRFLALLLTSFAAFTVLLTALGIYGVLSYVVSSRRREIAVRIAFGARGADVARLIGRQALPIVVVGLATGAWLNALTARTLAASIAGVRPAGAAPVAAVAALLAVVAMLALLAPARRAGRVPPMLVLRE